MSEPSPGPWRCQIAPAGFALPGERKRELEHDPYWHIVDAEHRTVAETYGGDEVDAANAHLIAAAPELLAFCAELLEAVTRSIDTVPPPLSPDGIARLKALIAMTEERL